MTSYLGKPCAHCQKDKPEKDRLKKYCSKRNCLAAKKREDQNQHFERALRNRMVGFTDPVAFYWALYRAQGKCCYACRRATGATKHLSVDHDHKCLSSHDRDKVCPRCIRGLLCSLCNRDVLGQAARDDIEYFKRFVEYLEKPPAQILLS